MQPNEEVSRKVLNWIQKLGLDQVRLAVHILWRSLHHVVCFHSSHRLLIEISPEDNTTKQLNHS